MTTRSFSRLTFSVLAVLAVGAVWALAVPAHAIPAQALPAQAAGTVDARGVQLSTSASCAQGDVEIEYTASGVDRQLTSFTAQGGAALHTYDVAVYSSTHDGVEYILSQTKSPPPPGTIVAVHVTIGRSPADAASGEFFLAYRCDARTNAEGGHNEVLDVCAGPYGTCPTSADEFLSLGTGTTPLVPRFTG